MLDGVFGIVLRPDPHADDIAIWIVLGRWRTHWKSPCTVFGAFGAGLPKLISRQPAYIPVYEVLDWNTYLPRQLHETPARGVAGRSCKLLPEPAVWGGVTLYSLVGGEGDRRGLPILEIVLVEKGIASLVPRYFERTFADLGAFNDASFRLVGAVAIFAAHRARHLVIASFPRHCRSFG